MPEFEGKPWPPGPWDKEPDKLQWVDKATGLQCLIVRNALGSLCGYVGVTEEHPYFGKDYNECRDIEAHGGLTYSSACQGDVCHEPEAGHTDHVWWLGFDCCHYLDVSPGLLTALERSAMVLGLGKFRPRGMPKEQYRTLNYVRRECTRLAEQLSKVKP